MPLVSCSDSRSQVGGSSVSKLGCGSTSPIGLDPHSTHDFLAGVLVWTVLNRRLIFISHVQAIDSPIIKYILTYLIITGPVFEMAPLYVVLTMNKLFPYAKTMVMCWRSICTHKYKTYHSFCHSKSITFPFFPSQPLLRHEQSSSSTKEVHRLHSQCHHAYSRKYNVGRFEFRLNLRRRHHHLQRCLLQFGQIFQEECRHPCVNPRTAVQTMKLYDGYALRMIRRKDMKGERLTGTFAGECH